MDTGGVGWGLLVENNREKELNKRYNGTALPLSLYDRKQAGLLGN